jgi:hypothetical protein
MKLIVIRPIPDVVRIEGLKHFNYQTKVKSGTQIHNLMKNRATFSINLKKYSWKEKSRLFAEIFKGFS